MVRSTALYNQYHTEMIAFQKGTGKPEYTGTKDKAYMLNCRVLELID
jgi:hypothetical protein